MAGGITGGQPCRVDTVTASHGGGGLISPARPAGFSRLGRGPRAWMIIRCRGGGPRSAMPLCLRRPMVPGRGPGGKPPARRRSLPAIGSRLLRVLPRRSDAGNAKAARGDQVQGENFGYNQAGYNAFSAGGPGRYTGGKDLRAAYLLLSIITAAAPGYIDAGCRWQEVMAIP
jgi:hypothetical protein